MTKATLTQADVDYFNAKLPAEMPPARCWEWTGRRDKDGYGRMSGQLAHRISWMLTHGPIPSGQCVCHACDNPPCVNPSHLFLGTQLENIEDMVLKGRKANGSRKPNAKLNCSAVRSIREQYRSGSTTFRELARQFGVAPSLIWRVVKGVSWTSVEVQDLVERNDTASVEIATLQRVVDALDGVFRANLDRLPYDDLIRLSTARGEAAFLLDRAQRSAGVGVAA